ncbi:MULTISPECIES: peptide deformylase [unclassified Arthrobacter]|uniref:peptide deformylase n=1 Tax=unclassified Arthrobacter TaxID=235627 RepID=UPI0002D5DDD5|nr:MULTISPECIES: peptide deformylase [unclassified Arthrobacter]PVE19996.1 peptide deformylase [Arthrobacter sp. Bz4]
MAVLSIRIIGDPVLRTPSAEVTSFGPELARLVSDMMETMDDVHGAGLAAPQVGVSLRVFTFRIDDVSGYVINPVLEVKTGTGDEELEGCLSIPGLGYPLKRADWARVTGVDIHGDAVAYEGTGMLARCFQHETDHLNGSLYIERLDGEHRKAAMRAIRSSAYSSVADQTTRDRSQSLGSSFGLGASTARPTTGTSRSGARRS